MLDGNTADPNWNRECLEILKETLRDNRLTYVADSKVINDPLVTMMLEDNIMFLSRCPANFDDQLLDRTLMSFDLEKLELMENISLRKTAARRRITSTELEYKGKVLRTVLVETSTLAGKGEKAVQKAKRLFMKDVDRAEALITIVNIATLVRAMAQLLMRRGVDALADDELPSLRRWGAKLLRNVTADYFMEACWKCMIRYDPRLNQCHFFNNADDQKASGFLSLMGIPKETLFTGGL